MAQASLGAPSVGAQLDPRRWIALVLLCAANFMVILDSQIVILALPAIAKGLTLTPEQTQWVLTANLLSFGGLLLLGGRAADLLGRRRMFMIGTALFMIVSVISGFAWNAEVIIAARALHGVSAALMAPTALSILSNMFREGSERNKALAGWHGIAGVGATVGLLIGGALTDNWGWEWIFFINAPVAALMLLLSPMLLQESREEGMVRTYDVAGAVTSTGALALLVYGIVIGPAAGWTSGKTLGYFGGALALGLLFVIIESRSSAPLVPLRIFRSLPLVGGNLVMITAGMMAVGMSVAIAMYTQGVLGYSSLEFGVKQAIMPVMAFIGAFVGQAFVTRLGVRPIAAACVVLMGAGSLLLAQAVANGGDYGDIFVGLLVFGPGLGAGTVAATASALAGVSAADSGLASGFNNAAFQIGGSFGVAVISTVIVQKAVGATPVLAMTAGFKAAFIACAIFAAVGVVLSIVLLRGRQRHESRHSL